MPNFFVPLNYNELPVEKENIRGDTNGSCGVGCKNGTILIDGNPFAFNITNTTNIYDKVCIDTCGKVGDYIKAGNASYQVAYIDPNGSYTYILGKYVERDGIYGVDPMGIIIGKQSGNVQIRIVFWDMIDKFGNVHRIHLIRNRNSTSGITNLYIYKMGSNSTDTYINVEVV